MEAQARDALLLQAKAALERAQELVLTTAAGDNLRSTLTAFAVADDFSLYIPLAKTDPRAMQIGFSPSVSLLSVQQDEATGAVTEVEIVGKALPPRNEAERKKARDLLAKRLPERAGDAYECIRIAPQRIEVRSNGGALAPTSAGVEFPENRRAVSDLTLLKRKAFAWFLAVRMPFLTGSVSPVLLGGAISWATRGQLSWGLFFLTILAGGLMHLGVNVINDYFDHESGNDDINVDFIRPFSGGSRVIQMGLLSSPEMLAGAAVLFAIPSGIGIYLAFAAGPLVILFGIAGLLSGIFYVGKPFNWNYHGLGEILVGLNFGTLMTLGAYYVQTGRLDWTPAIASIPVAALIAAVLYINEFPDFAADKAVGKRTWVVRLGRPHATHLYAVLMAVPYVTVLAAVAAGTLPVTTLIALISLPLAVQAVRVAYRWHSQPVELAPANALTIIIHLSTGLLLTLGYVWNGSNLSGLGYVIGFAVLFTAIVAFVAKGIEQEKQAFLASRQALLAGH